MLLNRFADATPPLAELIQTVHNITKTQFYNRCVQTCLQDNEPHRLCGVLGAGCPDLCVSASSSSTGQCQTL